MRANECICVNIKGKWNSSDAMVGVYNRPSNQKEEVYERFFKYGTRISKMHELLRVEILTSLIPVGIKNTGKHKMFS